LKEEQTICEMGTTALHWKGNFDIFKSIATKTCYLQKVTFE